MSDIVRVPIENGKYELVFNELDGEFLINRNGTQWNEGPLYSKMLIAIMYEIKAARDILQTIVTADNALASHCDLIRSYQEKYDQSKLDQRPMSVQLLEQAYENIKSLRQSGDAGHWTETDLERSIQVELYGTKTMGHDLQPECDCGEPCQSSTMACNFTRCTICNISDSSTPGEKALLRPCKGDS